MKIPIRSLCICLCLLWSLTNCDSAKEPVFQKMNNVKVTEIKGGQVTIAADAIYHNPNPIGGKLETTDISVVVNEVEVAVIRQELSADLAANGEFTIPVIATFPLNKVIENEADLISGVLSALIKKKIQVSYKGQTKVRVAGIGFDVPVDYQAEVILKKK